jgi:hypothetical protein
MTKEKVLVLNSTGKALKNVCLALKKAANEAGYKYKHLIFQVMA